MRYLNDTAGELAPVGATLAVALTEGKPCHYEFARGTYDSGRTAVSPTLIIAEIDENETVI